MKSYLPMLIFVLFKPMPMQLSQEILESINFLSIASNKILEMEQYSPEVTQMSQKRKVNLVWTFNAKDIGANIIQCFHAIVTGAIHCSPDQMAPLLCFLLRLPLMMAP